MPGGQWWGRESRVLRAVRARVLGDDDPAAPRPPAWWESDADPGTFRELHVTGRTGDVRLQLWTPAGLGDGQPAPLAIVHDGPEYERAARLTRFLAAQVAAGAVPPTRAALLDPGDRDVRYAANDDYADDLATLAVPAVMGVAATTSRIGIGLSLGALGMLHAQQRHPGLAGRLFLQSGSFFDPRFDSHESGFGGYDAVVAFVRRTATAAGTTAAITMTCGTDEENLRNNRVLAAALGAELHEVPGGHDFESWRDALDPHLTAVLAGEHPRQR